MGLSKNIFITSLMVLATGVLLNHFAPQHIDGIAHHPALKTITEHPTVIAILASLERYRHSVSSLISPTDDIKDEEIKKPKSKKGFVEKVFMDKELKEYDGQTKGGKGPYLAFLGRVYDVRRGMKYYGPDGGYAFFSGRDASRAFITGQFEEDGLIADVSGLSYHDYLGIDTWVQFYEKDYKYIGKLNGLYYDEKGVETPYNIEVKGWIANALEQKEEEDRKKQLFPGCNSEYFPDKGTTVWCTLKSGGVERKWVGVPRKMFTPGKVGAKCVCVRDAGPPSPQFVTDENKNNDDGDLSNPNLEEFKGCPPKEDTCKVPIEK